MKLDRYKVNLRVTNNTVYSFKKKVAIIKGKELLLIDCRNSVTTQKHLDYVAQTFNLTVVNEYWGIILNNYI